MNNMELLFKCQECGAFFKRKYLLDRHALIHTGEKKFSCTECGKQFTQRSNMLTHMKIHTDVKEFKCTKCGRPFRHKNALKRHEDHHLTKDNKFPCKICGEGFRFKSYLQGHMSVHTTRVTSHECAECGKSFKYKYKLDEHAVVHTGEKRFQCKRCGKKFGQTAGLWFHLNKGKVSCTVVDNVELQDQTANIKTPQRTPATVTTTLKCVVCGDEPGFKSNLVDKFKPQNMGIRYMCPKCDLNLESSDNLEEYFRKASIIMHNW